MPNVKLQITQTKVITIQQEVSDSQLHDLRQAAKGNSLKPSEDALLQYLAKDVRPEEIQEATNIKVERI